MICPCCSGKLYTECCKPYHNGSLPPTPLDLMRSRYCAYALKNARYIIETTHPKSPYFEKDRKKWEKGILEFCTTTQFIKLDIINTAEETVHFAAHLRQSGKDFVLDEQSHFQKVDGKWLYVSGIIKKD